MIYGYLHVICMDRCLSENNNHYVGNYFDIGKSIDNQSFNEKKISSLLFFVDFILTDPDLNLDR